MIAAGSRIIIITNTVPQAVGHSGALLPGPEV
jgi:hypothetical protein